MSLIASRHKVREVGRKVTFARHCLTSEERGVRRILPPFWDIETVTRIFSAVCGRITVRIRFEDIRQAGMSGPG